MITVIAGTNRPNAYSLKVARLIAQILNDSGAAAQTLSLEDIPQDLAASGMYGRVNEDFIAKVDPQVVDASALIIVAPEYNGSFPGILKTFLDALPAKSGWKAIADMPIMLVGVASGRAGNIRGIDHLTSVLHYMGAEVYSGNMTLPGVNKLISEEGEWLAGSEGAKETLVQRLEAFTRFARIVANS